jgi:hypothetical protein
MTFSMTFSCKNFDFNTEDCLKLKTNCIMGRPGCLLEGKVAFSEEIQKKLKNLEEKSQERKKNRRRS